MDDEKIKRAQKVYGTLCAALDSNELHYDKDEDDLSVECGIQGEDLPMKIKIKIDSGRQLILLLSHIPFVVPEDKRLDVAIATCVVNNKLVNGSFDYDVEDGHMFFRMTNSFIDSEIGNELFSYMFAVSCHTIDEYNDKFFALGKGFMSIDDFIAQM